MTKVMNQISREDVENFQIQVHCASDFGINVFEIYQNIATKSAIYPGQGTPFGLMYAALGLAEAGEVQNKVKKIFRDDGVLFFEDRVVFEPNNRGSETIVQVEFKEIAEERRTQIIKELGGLLWYMAATCNEIKATVSEVALMNLKELCSRGERGTLQGDGDNR